MKTRLLLSSLLIALSATSFAQTHKAHWSYNGKESPEHWGGFARPNIKPVS